MLSPAVPPSSTQPQMTLCFKMSLCAEAPQPRECGTGVHHAPHPRSRHGDCACAVWLVISCPGQLALSLGPGHRLTPQCAFSLSHRPEVALARAPSPRPFWPPVLTGRPLAALRGPWRPLAAPGLCPTLQPLLSCPTTSPYLCLHVTSLRVSLPRASLLRTQSPGLATPGGLASAPQHPRHLPHEAGVGCGLSPEQRPQCRDTVQGAVLT